MVQLFLAILTSISSAYVCRNIHRPRQPQLTHLNDAQFKNEIELNKKIRSRLDQDNPRWQKWVNNGGDWHPKRLDIWKQWGFFREDMVKTYGFDWFQQFRDAFDRLANGKHNPKDNGKLESFIINQAFLLASYTQNLRETTERIALAMQKLARVQVEMNLRNYRDEWAERQIRQAFPIDSHPNSAQFVNLKEMAMINKEISNLQKQREAEAFELASQYNLLNEMISELGILFSTHMVVAKAMLIESGVDLYDDHGNRLVIELLD